jgi:hypothetical protein
MTDEAMKLLAVCGLYCGACYHYRASFYDAERLTFEAARRGKEPQGFTCQGCRSGQLYIHQHCAHCMIRACAEEKGVLHCGLCAEFPCDRIKTFQSDGRVHHEDVLSQLEELREKGPEQWLADQAKDWTCECGESYGWYEETCAVCGLPLDSYGADPTV